MILNGVDFETNANRSALGGWSSAAYDKLIKEAYEATDSDTRSAKLVEAEKILVDEAPIVPVVFNQSFAFISAELSDVTADAYGNFILTEAELKNYKNYIKNED